jgi:hypothetical protein
MPAAARSPAQLEAARRNGAKSRGPATPEGKARSSRNALKHGLAAADHLLLAGEDRAAYEELLANLVAETEPGTELEAQLVRRLASALWRQHRADRLEAKLFAWTDTPKVFHAGKYLPVDAEANFDLARFAAVQRYQAQLGREVSRCLRELRLLKAEPLATIAPARNEPEPANANHPTAARPNEPEPPPAEEVSTRPAAKRRNEPEPAAPPAGRTPATAGHSPAAARRGPATFPVPDASEAASRRSPPSPHGIPRPSESVPQASGSQA